jgi:hypothetical protein
MAYRKKIESWLENDCKSWGDNVRIYLVDADCCNYAWHVEHQNTVYEITYRDIGEITLSSLSSKYWPGSFIREIYHGDNSKQSYQAMIGLLSDNFSNTYI